MELPRPIPPSTSSFQTPNPLLLANMPLGFGRMRGFEGKDSVYITSGLEKVGHLRGTPN